MKRLIKIVSLFFLFLIIWGSGFQTCYYYKESQIPEPQQPIYVADLSQSQKESYQEYITYLIALMNEYQDQKLDRGKEIARLEKELYEQGLKVQLYEQMFGVKIEVRTEPLVNKGG